MRTVSILDLTAGHLSAQRFGSSKLSLFRVEVSWAAEAHTCLASRVGENRKSAKRAGQVLIYADTKPGIKFMESALAGTGKGP